MSESPFRSNSSGNSLVQHWQPIVLAVAVVGLLVSSCGDGSSTSATERRAPSTDKSRGSVGLGPVAGTAPVETKPPAPQEPVSQEQKGLAKDPYQVGFLLHIADANGLVPDNELGGVSLTPTDHSACTSNIFQGNAVPTSDQNGIRIYSINPAFTALPWPCVWLSTARWDLRFKYKGVSKIARIDLNQQLGGTYLVQCVDLLPIPVDCNDHSNDQFNHDNAKIFADRAATDG